MAAIAGWIVNKNWGFDAFCVPSLSPVQYIPAMLETLKSLPDDPEDLKGLVALMGEEIKSLTLKVEDLQGQLAAHTCRRSHGLMQPFMARAARGLPWRARTWSSLSASSGWACSVRGSKPLSALVKSARASIC